MPYLDKTGLTKLWSKIKAVFAKKEHGTYYVVGNTSGTEGTWTGSNSDITSLYNGLTVAYKIGIKGASTTTLNINGLGAKTVKRNDGNLTTHIPVNSVVILVYDGIYWRWADYDINTQVRVYRQTSGYNSDYPILVSRTATSAIATAGTNSSYEGVYAVIAQDGKYTPTINPHTGAIKAQTYTEGGTLLSNKYAAKSHAHDDYATIQALEAGDIQIYQAERATCDGHGDNIRNTYLQLSGGTITAGSTIIMGASSNANSAKFKWGTVNSKTPYFGYASDQTDGTFVWSITGTAYNTGLAIGGGSGNLLWKGVKVATVSDIPTTLPASDVYAWAKAATKPTYTASEVGAAASNHSHSEYALAADVSSMSNSIANLNTTVNSLAKTTTTIYSTETQITSPAQGAVTSANFTFSSANSLQAGDRVKVYFAGAPSSGASTANAFQAGIVEFEVFQSGGYIVGSGSFMSNTGAQTVIISAQVVSSTQMKVSVWGLSANSYAAYGQVYLLKVERIR